LQRLSARLPFYHSAASGPAGAGVTPLPRQTIGAPGRGPGPARTRAAAAIGAVTP